MYMYMYLHVHVYTFITLHSPSLPPSLPLSQICHGADVTSEDASGHTPYDLIPSNQSGGERETATQLAELFRSAQEERERQLIGREEEEEEEGEGGGEEEMEMATEVVQPEAAKVKVCV